MVIYNKQWIDNLDIQKLADKWLKTGHLTADEYSGILKSYPSGYHESNIFARIGLFLFGLILISSTEGIFSTVILRDAYHYIWIQNIFFGMLAYAGAEFMIREKQYYRSGITDALMYAAAFSISLGLVLLISGREFSFDVDPVYYFLAVLPVFLYMALRFADAFLAFVAFACLVILNALLFLKLGAIGKELLPFETMILAVALYYIIKKEGIKESNRFYHKNIMIAKILSLVLLYIAGNYYVVRELGQSINKTVMDPTQEIPFALVFYCYTIILPLLFLWRGLRDKDYMLIWLGVLLEAAGVLTIRYYHSFLPAETAMILAGSLLVIIAWVSIRYLKVPRHGFTFTQYEELNEENITLASTIILSEIAAAKPAPSKDTFGGGSFGGGGAESSF